MVEMGDNAPSSAGGGGGVDSSTDSNVISSSLPATTITTKSPVASSSSSSSATSGGNSSKAAGPSHASGEEDEWWEVPCSDEEMSTYEPSSPQEIIRLFTALTRGEVLELNWKCPPKRPLTPEFKEEMEEEEEGEWSSEEEEEEGQERMGREEMKEFEFDDESIANASNIKLRKGVTKLPLSAQKKSGQFANVLKTVSKHSMEREQRRQQQAEEQQKLLLQQQQELEEQQREEEFAEMMDVNENQNGEELVAGELQEYGELPTDLDIDTDFADLAMQHAGHDLDQIDTSDLTLLSQSLNGPNHHQQQIFSGGLHQPSHLKSAVSYPHTITSSSAPPPHIIPPNHSHLMPPPPPPSSSSVGLTPHNKSNMPPPPNYMMNNPHHPITTFSPVPLPHQTNYMS